MEDGLFVGQDLLLWVWGKEDGGAWSHEAVVCGRRHHARYKLRKQARISEKLVARLVVNSSMT